MSKRKNDLVFMHETPTAPGGNHLYFICFYTKRARKWLEGSFLLASIAGQLRQSDEQRPALVMLPQDTYRDLLARARAQEEIAFIEHVDWFHSQKDDDLPRMEWLH